MVRELKTTGETISCDIDRLELLDHVGEIADSFSYMMSKTNWVLPSPSTALQVAEEWVGRKLRTGETPFFIRPFFVRWQEYCDDPQSEKDIIDTYLTGVFSKWISFV